MKSTKILVLLCVVVFASASLAATNPLNNPRGLAVDAKNNLYVANTLGGASGTGNVLVYSPTYVLQSTMTIKQDINLPIGVASTEWATCGSPLRARTGTAQPAA